MLKQVKNVNEDGMARSDAFKLTDKAKEELLCELNINEVGKSVKGLIKAETLAEKNLIYKLGLMQKMLIDFLEDQPKQQEQEKLWPVQLNLKDHKLSRKGKLLGQMLYRLKMWV